MTLLKKIFSLVSLLFLSLLSEAQVTYNFNFKRAPQLSDKRTRSELIVIDQRVNKERLGYLRTGAFNKFIPIQPVQQIDTLLSAYYGNIPGSQTLLLVLYDITIQDRPNGMEIGTFHFSGDFFSGEHGQYKYLAKVDSIYEVASGWDVTKDLIALAQNKIADLLNWYGNDNFMLINEKVLSLDETTHKRNNDKMSYPIYNATTFKKGIYLSVNDFLQNQPIDTEFIVQDYYRNDGPRLIGFYYPNKKGKKGERIDPATFFAIYSGSQWYVSNPNVRMNYENGDFYATRYFSGVTNNAQNAIVAGTMFGGLIGGAIAGGVAGTSNEKTRLAAYKALFDPEKKQFVPIKR